MRFFVIWMIFSGAFSFAIDAGTLRSSVVKLRSNVLGSSRQFRGSGVLFQHEGKVYAITSDHVEIHLGGLFVTARAKSAALGKEWPADYLVAEWGNGLALVSVGATEKDLPVAHLEDLRNRVEPSVGQSLTLYGYPWDADGLSEETGARVENPLADFPFYVFVQRLVEVSGSSGEFGMSGGGAFTGDGKFAGILAYQRIVSGDKNLVYLIPAKDVLEWIDTYFSQGDAYRVTFHEPSYYQLDHPGKYPVNDGMVYQFGEAGGHAVLQIGILDGDMPFTDRPTKPYADPRGQLAKVKAMLTSTTDKRPSFAHLFRGETEAQELFFQTPAQFFRLLDEAEARLVMKPR